MKNLNNHQQQQQSSTIDILDHDDTSLLHHDVDNVNDNDNSDISTQQQQEQQDDYFITGSENNNNNQNTSSNHNNNDNNDCKKVYELLKNENLSEHDIMLHLGLLSNTIETNIDNNISYQDSKNTTSSCTKNMLSTHLSTSTVNSLRRRRRRLPSSSLIVEQLNNQPNVINDHHNENNNRHSFINNIRNRFRSQTNTNNNHINNNNNNNNNNNRVRENIVVEINNDQNIDTLTNTTGNNNSNIDTTWIQNYRQENQIVFQIEIENTIRRYMNDDHINPNDLLHIPIPIPSIDIIRNQVHNNNILHSNNTNDHRNNNSNTTTTTTTIPRVDNRPNINIRGDPNQNANLINNNNNNNNRLTLRRILIAIAAVTAAFLCTIIQTLPLYHKLIYLYDDDDTDNDDYHHHNDKGTILSSSMSDHIDSSIDKLVYELVNVKHFMEHIESCPNISRQHIIKQENMKQKQYDNMNGTDDIQSLFHIHNDMTYYNDHNWYRTPKRSLSYKEDSYNMNNHTILSGMNDMIYHLYEKMKYIILHNMFLWKYWLYNEINCNDGVLHIPSKGVLINNYHKLIRNDSNHQEANIKLLHPYATKDGIQIIWFIPCSTNTNNDDWNIHRNQKHNNNNGNDRTNVYDTNPFINNDRVEKFLFSNNDNTNQTCQMNDDNIMSDTPLNNNDNTKNITRQQQCFRGIHDNIVSNDDILNAMQMGASIISTKKNSNHFDIHYDNISILYEYIPNIIHVIKQLLIDKYSVHSKALQPVAYRVTGVGSITGAGINHHSHNNNNNHVIKNNRHQYLLHHIMNITKYIQYIERLRRYNELAQLNINIPWPLRIIYPKRGSDTCHLMYDQYVNETFNIHTTLFLSDSSGYDYTGGTMLYVDNDYSNSDQYHNKKIHRGIMIDGNVGRLIISTGGYENLRCRLPTRTGIRATLQIWWNII